MKSDAQSVDHYIESLPPDRREAISEVRKVILSNLPAGYEETMQYGMISYVVPFSRYPITYNKQPLGYVGLASQKQYMVIYLMHIYGDASLERWFEDAYRATGKKLDKGKSCVRFRSLEHLPLDLVGQAVARTPIDDFIAMYENARASSKRKRTA